MKIKKDNDFKRDQYGFYSHPSCPSWDGSETKEFRDMWHNLNECKSSFIEFEYSASEKLIENWYEKGLCNCSEWVPKHKDPQAIVLSIHDTDDGPVAWFVSPLTHL